MPRSKNGDATARETLLAIQERKKKIITPKQQGHKQLLPLHPASIKKKNQRLPRTKRPPQLSHRQPEKQHQCHHPQVLR